MDKKASIFILLTIMGSTVISKSMASPGWSPPLDSDGRKTWNVLRKKNHEQEEESTRKHAERTAYSFNTAYAASARKLNAYIMRLHNLYAEQKKAHEDVDHKFQQQYNLFVKRLNGTVQNPIDPGTLSRLVWSGPQQPPITCNNDTSQDHQKSFGCLAPQNWQPFVGKSAQDVLNELNGKVSATPQQRYPLTNGRYQKQRSWSNYGRMRPKIYDSNGIPNQPQNQYQYPQGNIYTQPIPSDQQFMTDSNGDGIPDQLQTQPTQGTGYLSQDGFSESLGDDQSTQVMDYQQLRDDMSDISDEQNSQFTGPQQMPRQGRVLSIY